jgi:hypothetical protein
MGVGPRRHAVPYGRAYQARGPSLRPRHGTTGCFSCRAGPKSPANPAGRAGLWPATAGEGGREDGGGRGCDASDARGRLRRGASAWPQQGALEAAGASQQQPAACVLEGRGWGGGAPNLRLALA